MLLLSLSLTWTLLSAPDVERPSGKEELFRSVIEAMPDYQGFLTVDELHQSILELGEEYPGLVSVKAIGQTAGGAPIYEYRIGEGRNHALLFGFPPPTSRASTEP